MLCTFEQALSGQLLTAWQDNQGVLHAVLSGGGIAPEINSVVGRIWMLAGMQCATRFGRVENRANVADGPTRRCSEWIDKLHAIYVKPVVALAA